MFPGMGFLFGKKQGNPMDIDIDPNDLFSPDIVDAQKSSSEMDKLTKFQNDLDAEMKRGDMVDDQNMKSDVRKAALGLVSKGPEGKPAGEKKSGVQSRTPAAAQAQPGMGASSDGLQMPGFDGNPLEMET